MTAIRKILIANRGEIAMRILRTCRAMGIETVAVYSDFDRDALHVRHAGQAVAIGPAPARESYLNIEAILSAARRTGADAIHPGYGFLAENFAFAAACEDAGIAFIGPRSGVIRALGSKVEARRIAQEAGVPVTPSATENDFAKLGFPILIKASAGGGGRGMRIVRSAVQFQEAFASARSEAERAFGDGALLIEKYVEGARHVEIQIFGDHHGNLIHLFERDCSIQRRHQKVIEESPSPAATPDLRRRMAEAALALARKTGYTNAGTVEFLLAPSGEFYFIEVNTRIQVEHPVTEMITGLDLIRLQIQVAQGGALPAQPPSHASHAIEARLYAEDASNNFLPGAGTLRVWQPPEALDGVRVDSGVEEGTAIGVHYDPLLAKIIAHAPDRETAINKLAYALQALAAQGVTTNRDFLIDVLEHPEFRAGRAHAGFQLPPRAQDDREKTKDQACAAIAAAYIEHMEHARRAILPSLPLRFRNNPYPSPTMKFAVQGREVAASAAAPDVEILSVRPDYVDAIVTNYPVPTTKCQLPRGGIRCRFQIRWHGEECFIHSPFAQRTLTRLPRYPRRAGSASQKSATAPMPGQVLRVLAGAGQSVKAGDSLMVLEAMKMEQTIQAPADGVVKAILVQAGQIVAPGQMLVEIQSTEDAHVDTNANRSAANP